jgi:hypothetical protein
VAVDVPDFLQLSQLYAPELLGTVNVPNGATSGSTAFNVSPFATGLVVVLQPFVLIPTLVKITGNASGYKYAAVTMLTGLTTQAPVFAAIAGSIDNPYTVAITTASSTAGSTQVASVYQLFGAGVQLVQAPAAQPLPVVITPANEAEPLQAALIATGVLNTIAVSGSFTAVAGVAGTTLTVYGFAMSVRAGVSATVGAYQSILEDTSAAVVIARFDFNWATAAGLGNLERSVTIPHGLVLPLAAGIKIVAAANPGTMTHAGVIYYTATQAQ